MRKIINPFVGIKGYNCYACCPHNHDGLQMQFYEDGEYVSSEWLPDDKFQGYLNILHGGIQSTLLDELASWTIYVKADAAGVTSKMEIFYRKPVYANQGKIILKGRLQSIRGKIALVRTELFDSQGQMCTEAMISYYLLPADKAAKELNFPGKEKFFEEGKEQNGI
jgi:acyl-coenzyme A thioesterase PaaI-like protein